MISLSTHLFSYWSTPFTSQGEQRCQILQKFSYCSAFSQEIILHLDNEENGNESGYIALYIWYILYYSLISHLTPYTMHITASFCFGFPNYLPLIVPSTWKIELLNDKLTFSQVWNYFQAFTTMPPVSFFFLRNNAPSPSAQMYCSVPHLKNVSFSLWLNAAPRISRCECE